MCQLLVAGTGSGKTQSLDFPSSFANSVSSFSYPISGSAIGGIVIGTLFAVGGIGIAAWSTFKFVSIFLNPPTEIDLDDAAEDD